MFKYNIRDNLLFFQCEYLKFIFIYKKIYKVYHLLSGEDINV